MTGTDFCVNKPHMSWSYLNHLVYCVSEILNTFLCMFYILYNRFFFCLSTITDGKVLNPNDT